MTEVDTSFKQLFHAQYRHDKSSIIWFFSSRRLHLAERLSRAPILQSVANVCCAFHTLSHYT
ncbi:hypothetical protein FC18_GL001066 [Lacticaseibacillus sharpeae JCM 1186 = DSM 20505]|uniref:Uncharacterized protein n=1 Tax=Lacticaseibacillus sharpeae JCM 1186 = DSM 20505 TaxID=1291052 RepID=A0A0R1ZL58_9LACO|nr:hypothetical protein FC18_GL001066 [Lacticaseibacillus sharpeae JCM 1186 = DSM 20505]